MKEHIAVFDQPPQYGRGVPEYYNMQVHDVPIEKKDQIVGLLKHLGFVVIRKELADKRLFGYGNVGEREEGLCIYAQYRAGTDLLEYDNFWDKKETIEHEIDRLQMASDSGVS